MSAGYPLIDKVIVVTPSSLVKVSSFEPGLHIFPPSFALSFLSFPFLSFPSSSHLFSSPPSPLLPSSLLSSSLFTSLPHDLLELAQRDHQVARWACPPCLHRFWLQAGHRQAAAVLHGSARAPHSHAHSHHLV